MAFLIASQYSRLQRRPLGEEEAHRAFYEGNQVVLREYMEPVILDMVSLEIYSQYETYIAPLLDSLRQGKQWDETRDLRPYWKLS